MVAEKLAAVTMDKPNDANVINNIGTGIAHYFNLSLFIYITGSFVDGINMSWDIAATETALIFKICHRTSRSRKPSPPNLVGRLKILQVQCRLK